ncbi:dihydrolipoamide acetyltransferase family protein [Nesterenkonia flava]|uniref:Dihydrolipoamide acetyltransferase component of pyruvate dehydrogenase complex n=1 Tax=Nesterenkonia flava TaxID=469799 RepID=A0ABU1FVU0_9MICC|nr:dihydrolipoamide acetyltransferase family protein [Nesterenkonia flava]MDR5712733.1 dihydrolipoamide acetyltransferase family protein [Nesterenkonia flava]
MSQTFNLPDVGEGLTEAEITAWRVAVGDEVAVNDIVCEIETAKSLVELPVPFAGTVEELVVPEGETVEVGQPIIRITTAEDGPEAPRSNAGSSAEGRASEGSASATSQPEKDTKALVGSGPKADAPKHRPRLRPTAPDLVENVEIDDAEPAPHQGFQTGDLADIVAKASPPVRALAKRLGVAVWELVGSGRNGQITRDDVERQARHKKQLRDSGQTPAAGAPTPGRRPTSPQEAGLLFDGPREEKIQVRGVRKATALNVSASASTVPHVSVFKEVDVTRTMELRQALKNEPSYKGLSVSPMLFAAKAIIWAARRNPQINAAWHETHYTLRNYVNLGIAAATPRGLVVPVIHEAHTYNTQGLAAAITQLTIDAREGKTTPGEMQGGTISITNIGVLGLDSGTPILPPGHASIVALGAVRKKPWVVDGQIVPRDVMVIGGSFDHRLIDGDLAGAFISDVASVLEQPGLLLD